MSVSCLNVCDFILWAKVIFVIDVRWAQIVKKYIFLSGYHLRMFTVYAPRALTPFKLLSKKKLR